MMNIPIQAHENRRIAYTDRVDGYFEFTCGTHNQNTNGYFRGDTCFIKEILPLSTSSMFPIQVMPHGFSFNDQLECSLLLDEQAFAISTQESGFTINLSDFNQNSTWIKQEAASFTYWANSEGLALISESDFFVRSMAHSLSIEITPNQASFNQDAFTTFYLIIESPSSSNQDQQSYSQTNLRQNETPFNKALRLAQNDALAIHKEKVAAFIDSISCVSSNSDFSKSLMWSQWSAWQLVTGREHRGIWAGLPWFRDNWGRDTFIALSGVLLVSGQFAEARAVLLGFALYQDRDPSSKTYGRIPNRYRNENDVIYNTADGSLWFIRSVWDYLSYTGDTSILDKLSSTIDLCFESFISREIDEHGFLLHDDADTWMDARIENNHALSPRGNRAIEIQALWYSCLGIGSRIAKLQGDESKHTERAVLAEKLKESFNTYFWNEERNCFADHLDAGKRGEWLPDFTVRPNQLFAISVGSDLGRGIRSGEVDQISVEGSDLLSRQSASSLLGAVDRELVSPYGLYSLCPSHPLFHPHHENQAMYHKDAAYHNGTIWPWITGAYISAKVLYSNSLDHMSESILKNYSSMILQKGTVGTLSENIHATLDESGNPILSGAWSQAWSLSEFNRNIYQDVLGFKPRLTENKIDFRPHLPSYIHDWKGKFYFGVHSNITFSIRRETKNEGEGLLCSLVWKISLSEKEAFDSLLLNETVLRPNTPLELFIPQKTSSKKDFPSHDLFLPWCASMHVKSYLNDLILNDRNNAFLDSDNTSATLEWYFDSTVSAMLGGGCASGARSGDAVGSFDATPSGAPPATTSDSFLGASYSKEKTLFRLFAPTATSVSLLLFEEGHDASVYAGAHASAAPTKTGEKATALTEAGVCAKYSLSKHNSFLQSGIWEIEVPGDLHGVYYQFSIHAHGIIRPSADPYAYACGVNGTRSMVCDFSKTNPEDWDAIKVPILDSPNDAIPYEVHIADISSSPTWNGDPSLKRSYLGAIQEGTLVGESIPSGFDHICNLGITHVQLLPIFDFQSVDETRIQDAVYANKAVNGLFNWGYDPQNYNAPEGSYSLNPYNGVERIKELKTLIAAFAKKGIGVIMDVVYNHVPSKHQSSFNICVPGYYFRIDGYSAAGDDTASEREMFRKFMIDSLSWWLAEYKLCGFRFDIMGLHDVQTMNKIAKALRKIKPDVLLYGEGWDMYRAQKMKPASMINSKDLKGIGCFNDAFRHGIKGSVFVPYSRGFLHGGYNIESLKFGIVGAVSHPQVANHLVQGTEMPRPWGKASDRRTAQTVNYAEIHDNSTLFDAFFITESDINFEKKENMEIRSLHQDQISASGTDLAIGIRSQHRDLISTSGTDLAIEIRSQHREQILPSRSDLCIGIRSQPREQISPSRSDLVTRIRSRKNRIL